MSEAKLRKYRIVYSSRDDDFEAKLNVLAEENYVLDKFTYSPAGVDEKNDVYMGVMKLDTGNYENVVNLRDVAPELVDDAIAGGFEIASSSLSTKFVRMIRRKKL